jgi:hypothetical protein
VAVLQGLAVGHDDDPVGAEDGVDAVGDRDHGAVVQCRAQSFLRSILQTLHFDRKTLQIPFHPQFFGKISTQTTTDKNFSTNYQHTQEF